MKLSKLLSILFLIRCVEDVILQAGLVCPASHDTSHEIKLTCPKKYSHLFDIDLIASNTPNYNKMVVKLRKTHKGVSVFANRMIKKQEIVAYYKVMVQLRSSYPNPFKNFYNLQVYSKQQTLIAEYTADIFEESIEPPNGTIPYWGFLFNEPGENEKENCGLFLNIMDVYRDKDVIEPGDVLIYNLHATRDIQPGEELTWCYGLGYIRQGYKSSCSNPVNLNFQNSFLNKPRK